MFLDKYAPKKVNEILSSTVAKEITEWLKTREIEVNKDSKSKSKSPPAVLLSGDTGVGKTALINAIANEYNYEILYVDEENIERFESYTQSCGLFNKRLIVIDNAEMINFKEILNFIPTSKNPIILTTTDPKNKKFQDIIKFCKQINIPKPTYLQISKVLEKIAAAEGISVDKTVIEEISKNANGNLRAAIIDFEVVAMGRKKIAQSDLILETRDNVVDIFKGLQRIFKAKNLSEAKNAYNEIEEEPKNILLWIEENIPAEYKTPLEIFNAYYLAARADIFLGRIINRQYWGFLRYINEYLFGISTAKTKTNFSFVKYKFPSFLLKASKAKSEKALKQSIGRKISPFLHIPPRMVDLYIPLFSILLKKEKVKEEDLIKHYKFDEAEMEYLKEIAHELKI